jgi:transcriptional regulator with XRE-family HTH domain
LQTGEMAQRFDLDEPKTFLRQFMTEHRLPVVEVATAAGVSPRSVSRLRGTLVADAAIPRTSTIQRVADALSRLTQVDADEIFAGLMTAAGRGAEVLQADFGLCGVAELTRYYQEMSPLARHLLLEQARLLARELPDTEPSS